MANRISEPRVNAPLIPETPTASVSPKVTTMIGQMTSGTATSGQLYVDVDLNAEAALFGDNSVISTMIRSFRAVNQTSQLNIIPLDDDGGATAAAGAVVFSGTATEAGEIDVFVVNQERKYSVGVANGDTATDIGDALEALITADTKAMATAVNTAGSVALTAVNAGSIGNKYTIRVSGSVAGVTTAITAFTGGATDPATTGLEDLITYKSDIVIPDEYDRSALLTLLNSRFNIDNNVLDGRMIIGKTDTKDNLVTLGDGLNSQSLVIFGDKPVDATDQKGSAILAGDFERSSHFAGLRTLRLEDGTNIADFMTTTEPRDNIGGVHTSSLPYFNTVTTLPVIENSEGFTDGEQDDLIAAGISVMGNNLADNTLLVGTVVTTYKTNPQGFPDETYKYLSYVDTATASREFIWTSLKIDYAQKRLTLGQGVAGYSFATVGGVRADMVRYYSTLAGADYVLLQGGVIEENDDGRAIADIYKDNLTVSIDIKAGEIFITSLLPIITQARTIQAPLNIRFNINEIPA